MMPPEFKCQETQDPQVYRLHYYSNRKHLKGMAIGIIRDIARSLYNLKIDIAVLYDGIAENRLAYKNHIILEIHELGPYNTSRPMKATISSAELKLLTSGDSLICHVGEDKQRGCFISEPIFNSIFPFHIIFDQELKIRRTGNSLSKKLPQINPNNMTYRPRLNELFQCLKPPLMLTLTNILDNINSDFIMEAIDQESLGHYQTFQLKGQMIRLMDDNSYILYMSSLVVKKLTDLKRQGFYISDFPLHDKSRDLLLIHQYHQVEQDLNLRVETLTAQLQQSTTLLQAEKSKVNQLMSSMMPAAMRKLAQEGQMVRAQHCPKISLLIASLVGITSLCNEKEPMQVIGFINTLLDQFDSLLDDSSIYKVSISNSLRRIPEMITIYSLRLYYIFFNSPIK